MIQKHIQTCVTISQLQPEPHPLEAVAKCAETCWNQYDLKSLEKDDDTQWSNVKAL